MKLLNTKHVTIAVKNTTKKQKAEAVLFAGIVVSSLVLLKLLSSK